MIGWVIWSHLSEHCWSYGLVSRWSHRSAQFPVPVLPHSVLGSRHCRPFRTKVRKKVYSPKGIDPPKCKYCLNRPEALSKDHEAETIPLQQIWRQSFILPHLYLPKLLQIFVAKTVIILDHKLMTTNKGFIHIQIVKPRSPNPGGNIYFSFW